MTDDRGTGNRAATQSFAGVFDTYEAALASAPPELPHGYDNPESAELYLKRLGLDDYDYPAMFWILRSIDDGRRRVVDLGGSVGIKYFAYRRFVQFPADLAWKVIDVPAVVARGTAFAAQRGVSGALTFSDRYADIDGAEVLLASGSLQYLQVTLAELLESAPAKPARVIVNTTPMHHALSFFTLNGIGTAYCPYRVQAHGPFLDAIERCGYKLRDEWRNLGKTMEIPGHPEHTVAAYSGFCFDAR